jgi:hypothetical protein
MTRPGWRAAGLVCAAALICGSAYASDGGQPASAAKPADLSGLTVTAPEKPDPLVDKTTQFVRSHVPENRGGQLARFRDRICVRVIGLPPSYGAFVARRIVAVAGAAHAPIDRTTGCTPNVNVIFSANPQAQLDDIAKRRDILFGFQFATNLKRTATFERPIQSWYVTRSVGTDGQSVLELNHGTTFMEDQHGLTSVGGTITGKAGSRLGTDQSSELVHSLILVDANKVADAKIGAVADYIALLALSRWQGLERCNAVSTILNLMADDCAEAPEAITAEDKALLAALYTTDPREAGSQQRMAIAERMSQAAKTATAP